MNIEVGDTVRGMRVIDADWTKSVSGEVTCINDPCPIPGVDEPSVIVDDSSDGEVPVRKSNIEGVVED